MKNKKAQFNFNLIFAIIVGIFILFIAIYSAVRYSSTSSYLYNTQVSEKVNILLDPLESSLASSLATSINFREETKIVAGCNENDFGTSSVEVDVKSSVGGWSGFGVPSSSANKYIFSSKIEQGNQLSIFSKAFEMPFFVSDLIYASMKEYCFINPPENIRDEITDINVSNIRIVSSKGSCKKNSTTVCFGTGSCTINIYCSGENCESYEYGTVEKAGATLNYVGDALMYAAIMSDTSLYKCNLNRLMFRVSKLAELYYNKANIIEERGCTIGELKQQLLQLKAVAVKNPNPRQIYDISKLADETNSYLGGCRLW